MQVWRSGGASWEEFDLDARLWTIPAARMKASKEHRVPLSSHAIALMESMPRLGAIVFPGKRKATPLFDMSLTAVIRAYGKGCSHGA